MMCNYGKTFKKLTSMDGITYYVQSMMDISMMPKVALIVRAGSMMEEYHELGLSHFLEHMLVDKLKYPIHNNHIVSGHAYTNFHETVYFFYNCTRKEDDTYFIFECMNAINEILSGTELNPDSMERVRRDVQNEHLISGVGKESALKELFTDNHPNIHLSIGDISLINAFSYDDVLNYHRKWYTPNNAAIIIESNLEVNKIESFIYNQNAKLQISPLNKSYLENNGNKKWSCMSGVKERYDENIVRPTLYFISKYHRLISSPKKYMESLVNLELAQEAFKLVMSNYFSSQGMQYCDIDGTVELFTNDWYLIRFKITIDKDITEINDIIHYLKLMEIDQIIFYKAKEIYHQKIGERTKDYLAYGKDFFINECIQNFLFSEPILDLIDEINFAHNAIDKASFKNVQKCFNYVKNNCVLMHQQKSSGNVCDGN